MAMDLSQAEYWKQAWVRHLEAYLAAPPRCGYWLASQFPCSRLRILEIAGGSCRDSRHLATLGGDVVGSDFEQETLDHLARRFPDSRLKLQREDAFALSLPSKSVDLSFHNGFWICFRDDERLCALIREQARVTRRHMVALVHNRENQALVRSFGERARNDALYDVRFFQRDELAPLLHQAGIRYRALRLFKFGGRIDVLYSRRLRGLPNPFVRLAPLVVPRLYEGLSWREAERIACVVELE